MYLLWRITDDISNISVDEFNRDYNGIYGYMKLQLGNYSIGYIPDVGVPLEGNSEILYYISCLIECGVSVKKGKISEINLLNYNLLKIEVSYESFVDVKVICTRDNSVEGEFLLTFEELVNEIKFNYSKLYNYVNEHNASLLEADMIKKIVALYNEFTSMLIS